MHGKVSYVHKKEILMHGTMILLMHREDIFYHRIKIGFFRLLFLRLLIEAIDHVEHGVLRRNAIPGLGAALSVDGAAHIAEVAQEVKGHWALLCFTSGLNVNLHHKQWVDR